MDCVLNLMYNFMSSLNCISADNTCNMINNESNNEVIISEIIDRDIIINSIDIEEEIIEDNNFLIVNVIMVKSITNICGICLDYMDDKITILKCNHIFHESCINEWLSSNDTCPYCRTVIID
jgi:hypothetical protein